jgi:hypothetical protein
MDAYITDMSILSEVFGTFDIKTLMGWGIPGWTTTGAEVSHLKREFHMLKVYTQSSRIQLLNFGPNPENLCVTFESHEDVRPGDSYRLHYTVTASQGGGPNSVVVRSPSGKALRLNIYSTVT